MMIPSHPFLANLATPCRVLKLGKISLASSRYFSRSINVSILKLIPYNQRQTNMLDTVVLTIQRDKFTLLDPIKDLVAPWDLQSRTSKYEKYVKNPSARDKNAGLYQPRLTGVKRWTSGQAFQSVLKVEFSVPKLLYGNNLEEVEEKDFPLVIEALRSRLFQMGVIISIADLEAAPVTVFHPSKNIVLTNGYTASLVMKELAKINLKDRKSVV